MVDKATKHSYINHGNVASETCEGMTNAGEPSRSGVRCEVRYRYRWRADKSTANLGDASSVYLSPPTTNKKS